MATRQGGNRLDIITPLDNGNFILYGAAGTAHFVSTMVMQFAPTVSFVGSLQLFGKIMGPAGDSAPYLPIPYRRVNVAGAVSDRILIPDPITSVGIIEVPCNGLTLAILVTCTAGQCQVYCMDLQGPSTA